MCCTACLAEEGKGSRKGYSIYHYARANARASVPCRKSVQKQESRRFSISGKGRKRGKSTGMAEKNMASSIRKTQKIPEKNRDDGEKTRRAPAQNRQKKWFGNRKIPEWLIKKQQAASVKRKRFRRKIGMTEEKTRQKPAQDWQKNDSETEKYRNGW